MRKNKIILIGGGGHCKACIDVIEKEDKYDIFGIIDVKEKIGNKVLNYTIIGEDKDIPKFTKQDFNFLVTIGHLGSPELRSKIINQLKEEGAKMPIIVSPLSYVSNYAKIEQGTIVMHGAIVNANAHIKESCIINNNSLIEHDVVVENNVHISTGAIINGNCKIGENTLVGSGAVIKHSVKVNINTIIGAGAIVTKDITEKGVYVGVPARRIK